MNEKVYKETEGMKDMTENEMEFRVEKDSIGTKDVPENVYYGVQSLRAAENFHITGLNMHPEIINRRVLFLLPHNFHPKHMHTSFLFSS